MPQWESGVIFPHLGSRIERQNQRVQWCDYVNFLTGLQVYPDGLIHYSTAKLHWQLESGPVSMPQGSISKILACRELFPHCEYVARGNDDTELLIDTARHMNVKHDLRELTPEFLRKARRAIREVKTDAA